MRYRIYGIIFDKYLFLYDILPVTKTQNDHINRKNKQIHLW